MSATRPVRVLCIEDNPAYAGLIQDMLTEAHRVGWNLPRFETRPVARLEEALELLSDETFDVVLCDLDLPDSRPGETVGRLRRGVRGVPLVVLTGREGAELARKSVRAGVQDYVYKNEATASLLARTLVNAIERHEHKRALQEAHDALERRVEERTAELRQANEDLRAEIAERHRAEEALRESEERFRRAVLDSPFPTMLHAEDGEVLLVNRVWEELSGYSIEEIPTIADWAAAAYGERGTQVEAEIGRLYDLDASVDEGEYEVITKGGGTRTWHFSSSPLGALPDGRRLVLSAALDVTERKRMEQELRQQERLAAVGQLAGGIAHDFNNILASIILYAQMPLRGSGVSPRTESALRTILEESNRAADLVQQILDFSRSAMMDTKPVGMVRLVRNALGLLRRTLPENIRLVTQTSSAPCTVAADPTRLHQALMNLALNARDAMPEGGELRLEVGCGTVEPGEDPPVAGMPPGRWACLTVSDTGIGMTPEVQDHLFEPFFTTKDQGEGTGLGLAQVYGIVKQHQGFIDVETAVGEGTTFTIFLPLLEGEGAAPGEESERAPLPRGSETVLLVEDADPLRRAIKTGLESLGYECIAVRNGREALDTVSLRGVDIVLTDVVMPEMGGEALLRELRREAPRLKMVAMTGHTSDKGIPELEDAGFDDALAKPFSIGELVVVVRDVLDNTET